MRELDGMRIIGSADGEFTQNPRSKSRELVLLRRQPVGGDSVK